MPISPTGLPTPVVGDDPDVPSDMLTLATALDKTTVPQFTTTAARDAARTAGATFMLCFVGDAQYRWRLGAWTLVDPPKGLLARTVLVGTPSFDTTGGTILTTTATLTTQRWLRVHTNLQGQQVTSATATFAATIFCNGTGQTRIAVGPVELSQTIIVNGETHFQAPAGVFTADLRISALTAGAFRPTPTQTYLSITDAGP